MNEPTKHCPKCNQDKPLSKFGKDKNRKDGLNPHCKDCRSAYSSKEEVKARHREWWKANKERIYSEYKERYGERWAASANKSYSIKRDRVNRWKDKAIESAGGCCQRCGYSEFRACLTFHHVDPSTKDGDVYTLIKGDDFDTVLAEIDKCALLCWNCHVAFEAGYWSADFIKRDGIGYTIGETCLQTG